MDAWGWIAMGIYVGLSAVAGYSMTRIWLAVEKLLRK